MEFWEIPPCCMMHDAHTMCMLPTSWTYCPEHAGTPSANANWEILMHAGVHDAHDPDRMCTSWECGKSSGLQLSTICKSGNDTLGRRAQTVSNRMDETCAGLWIGKWPVSRSGTSMRVRTIIA
jgi:hypothetical protein